MVSTLTRPERRFRSDVLVGGLILAFTAVPVAARLPSEHVLLEALRPNLYPIDVAVNVLGYVPLGIALRSRGARSALLIAVLLSVFAEMTQLFTSDRMPAVIDVFTNVIGAALGLSLAAKRPLMPELLHIGPRHALLAAMTAAVYLVAGSGFTVEAVLRKIEVSIAAPPWASTSTHGLLDPGDVEMYLSFDRMDGEVLGDGSANRLRGAAVNGPTLSPGVVGTAISLNGKQWIDLGDPLSLRLVGSMTLSAWVRPTRFPVDDAAIISSLTNNELGYQLDLTVDEGPRTIGFKIAGASGRLMARYGKTPVVLDRWYHVAGVYDSEAQTLDVYLDGVLDNGCLIGTVTDRQLPSRRHTFVGRRAGMVGFELTGAIDEARIESRARSADAIRGEVSRAVQAVGRAYDVAPLETDQTGAADSCTKPPHARVAGPLVLLGMLIAVACAGVFGGASFVAWTAGLCFVVGAVAGVWRSLSDVALWSAMWCVPLGGIFVLAAVRPTRATPRGGGAGVADDSVDPPDAAA